MPHTAVQRGARSCGATPRNRVAEGACAHRRGDPGSSMPAPTMRRDPKGYYARLGVGPGATPDSITMAYRRGARIVHPDVPGTGDAEAFVALKQAYDVLIHEKRRAAYDRSAEEDAPRTQSEPDAGAIGPRPFPEVAVPASRHPRWRDLTIPGWAGLVVVMLIRFVEVGAHLFGSPSPPRSETIP